MKIRCTLLLSILLLLGSGMPVRAGESFGALERRNTSYRVLGALPAGERMGPEWYAYVLATSYTTVDLPGPVRSRAQVPWLALGDELFDRTRAAEVLSALAAHLTVVTEPDSGPELKLVSSFADESRNASSSSTFRSPVHAFAPENIHMSGFEIPGCAFLEQARTRIVYRLQDGDGNPIGIDVSRPFELRSSSRSGQQEFVFPFALADGARLPDIAFGLVDVEFLPPLRYEKIYITPETVGRTIDFDGGKVTPLAYEPGTVHLAFDMPMGRELRTDGYWFCARRDGQLYDIGAEMLLYSRDAYEAFRQAPGLSYKKFVRQFGEYRLQAVGGRGVVVLRTGMEADGVWMYRRVEERYEDRLAARVILLSRTDNGTFRQGYLERGRDGVLRGEGSPEAEAHRRGQPVEGLYEEEPEAPAFYAEGTQAMQAFIARNLRYPEEAVQKGITGRVIVRLTISSEGEAEAAEIYQGVDPLLDEEALRVVRMLEKWNPGRQDGEPVRSFLILPILFQLP